MTKPRDELLERYGDAVAQDPRRPSDGVRNAARAHAQMLRDQAAAVQQIEGNAPTTKPAANQSQWTLSLVASLAVVGLVGLIFVQIDRGTTDEREAGLGLATPGPAPSPTESPNVANAPAPINASAATVARKEVSNRLKPNTAPVPSPVQDAAKSTDPLEARHTEAAIPFAETKAPARADKKMTDTVAGAVAPQVARMQGIGESATRIAPAARAVAPPPAAPAPIAPPGPAPSVAAATANISAAPLPESHQRARQMPATTPSTVFLEAARLGKNEVLQQLLAQGVDIDTRDDTGNTALMLAVRHRQVSVVRTLLASGANTRLTNHDGMNALQLANGLGLTDMVQLLQSPQ